MATGFKFSLEKVLDIRKEKEQQSIMDFQKAQKEKLGLENELQEYKDNYNKYNGIKAGESIVYQKIKRNYLQSVTSAISKTEVAITFKDIEVEDKRQKAKEKQIERKTVEILKDKKYTSFIKEQERVEQINNDEFALYGHIRKLERR